MIQPHDDVAFFDDITDLDWYLGNNAAFQILDNLNLTGGNDFSFTHGDFFDVGKGRPDQGDGNESDKADQDE